jgi:hypothetical protein
VLRDADIAPVEQKPVALVLVLRHASRKKHAGGGKNVVAPAVAGHPQGIAQRVENLERVALGVAVLDLGDEAAVVGPAGLLVLTNGAEDLLIVGPARVVRIMVPGRFILAEELLVSARNSSMVSSPGGRAGICCHWRLASTAPSWSSSVA